MLPKIHRPETAIVASFHNAGPLQHTDVHLDQANSVAHCAWLTLCKQRGPGVTDFGLPAVSRECCSKSIAALTAFRFNFYAGVD